jgi:hypothetical protein
MPATEQIFSAFVLRLRKKVIPKGSLWDGAARLQEFYFRASAMR